MRPSHFIIPVALLCGCLAENPGDDAPRVPPGSEFTLTPSPNPRIRFKRQSRLQRDLAGALSLDEDEVCKEVGLFDCFSTHRMALGGVEPYESNIYSPLPDTTATAPLAVERVVLSACAERADRDSTTESPLIYSKRLVGADGRIADLYGEAATDSITRLFNALLRRDPLPAEIESVRSLYGGILATDDPQPGRTFKVLSCFVVGTMMEGLFY